MRRIPVCLIAQECGDSFGGVESRHDRIRRADAVTIVTGEEQAGRLLFEILYRTFDFCIAKFILRNRARNKTCVLKLGLAVDPEQPPRIRECRIHSELTVAVAQLRMASAANERGYAYMAIRSAVREDTRREKHAKRPKIFLGEIGRASCRER